VVVQALNLTLRLPRILVEILISSIKTTSNLYKRTLTGDYALVVVEALMLSLVASEK
jgi:hypothetical protein